MQKEVHEKNLKTSNKEVKTFEVTEEDILDTRKLADKILIHFLDNDREKYPDIWNNDPAELAAFNREMGLDDDEVLYEREHIIY